MIPLMVKIRQEHQSIVEKVAELSLETREFLSVTTAKRQEQAEKQAQELQAFYKDSSGNKSAVFIRNSPSQNCSS